MVVEHKLRQFFIDIGTNVKLSVIDGFGRGPELGLIIGGRCQDVAPCETLLELFGIIDRLKAGDYSDFPYLNDELGEIA